MSPLDPVEFVGRYVLYAELSSGGMGSVHLGRLFAPGGFSRAVAIKRMHPQLAQDPEFRKMFLDEARLAARIRHPNVVATHDVVVGAGEVFLVLDYVHGETLSRLLRKLRANGRPLEPRIAVTLALGVLGGLHAAHEACAADGTPLEIVHRDVSPQNVMVDTDGVPHLLDFGIARATQRLRNTPNQAVMGKFAYMSPEQAQGLELDRRSDIFSASVLLWEALVGRELFGDSEPMRALQRVTKEPIAPPSSLRPDLPKELDAIIMRGLERDRALRYPTAAKMAEALEATRLHAGSREIAEWMLALTPETIAARGRLIREVEASPIAPPSGKWALKQAEDHAEDDAHSRSSEATSVLFEDEDRGLTVELAPPSPERSANASMLEAIARGDAESSPPTSPPKAIASGRGRLAMIGALAIVSTVSMVVIGVALRSASVRSDAALPMKVPSQTDSVALFEAAPAAPPIDPRAETLAMVGAPASSPSTTASSGGRSIAAAGASQSAPVASEMRPKKSAVFAPDSGARPPAVRPKCDPPYVIDERGVRRFIPECL